MASRNADSGPVRVGSILVPRADPGVWSAISLLARALDGCSESLRYDRFLPRWYSVHVHVLPGWIRWISMVFRQHARATALAWNGCRAGPGLLAGDVGLGWFVLADGEEAAINSGDYVNTLASRTVPRRRSRRRSPGRGGTFVTLDT